MTHIQKIDKLKHPEGYRIAADSTGLLISTPGAKGGNHVVIKAEHLEQFLADADAVINSMVMNRKGAA